MPNIISHFQTLPQFPLSKSLFPTSTRRDSSLSFPKSAPVIKCAKKSKRTGKFRYPSERKKLRHRELSPAEKEKHLQGIWRLSKLGVSVHDDPGKDFWGVSVPLLEQIAKVLEVPVASMLPAEAFTVVRKSFDARKLQKGPKFVYTVDMDAKKLIDLEPHCGEFIYELEPKVGQRDLLENERVSGDLMSMLRDHQKINGAASSSRLECDDYNMANGAHNIGLTKKPKVVIVGSGPAGLFASLVLAELGADVTLVERGEAVEQRGRDIGALVVRRMLQMESNFCFGEGGAGTWSDGKLVTRIGRNNDSVLSVLKTLVHFGAPCSILVDGKPHLGTDRLIPLLRNFRRYLQELGVDVRFGTRVDNLVVNAEHVTGVEISDSKGSSELSSQKLECDAVVLAVGHSARDTYDMLLSHNVDIVRKDFSVGLRIEHPQELINNIQYSGLANEVRSGRGKVPVADYQVAKYVTENDGHTSSNVEPTSRGCYSFCMCPGGQVVLTSTNPAELCINGMSFSKRSSKWANAALVVTVSSQDFEALDFHGPLAGVQFQRMLERKAATMGGGNFVVPVQTVPDFVDGRLSETSIPSSSYRLGVKAANLHELFPIQITEALRRAISLFDKELPGFISERALLHGVETRTSSPIQITRNSDTWESTSLKGLYPVGEGAGYAGGIVSAAVDGMYAGLAAAQNLGLYTGSIESMFGKTQNSAFIKY